MYAAATAFGVALYAGCAGNVPLEYEMNSAQVKGVIYTL